MRTGAVFTNHSQEHSLSVSPRFSKFECNTTSDWLNRTVVGIKIHRHETDSDAETLIQCERERGRRGCVLSKKSVPQASKTQYLIRLYFGEVIFLSSSSGSLGNQRIAWEEIHVSVLGIDQSILLSIVLLAVITDVHAL